MRLIKLIFLTTLIFLNSSFGGGLLKSCFDDGAQGDAVSNQFNGKNQGNDTLQNPSLDDKTQGGVVNDSKGNPNNDTLSGDLLDKNKLEKDLKERDLKQNVSTNRNNNTPSDFLKQITKEFANDLNNIFPKFKKVLKATEKNIQEERKIALKNRILDA